MGEHSGANFAYLFVRGFTSDLRIDRNIKIKTMPSNT